MNGDIIGFSPLIMLYVEIDKSLKMNNECFSLHNHQSKAGICLDSSSGKSLLGKSLSLVS
jgi:hypothetical protein